MEGNERLNNFTNLFKSVPSPIGGRYGVTPWTDFLSSASRIVFEHPVTREASSRPKRLAAQVAGELTRCMGDEKAV